MCCRIKDQAHMIIKHGGIANCHLYTMLGGYKVNYSGEVSRVNLD